MRIANLDQITASEPGRSYKRRLLDAMDLDRTCTVLDLGCGPGADLAGMARLAGKVIGADHDPEMIAEATHRVGALGNVSLLRADAHSLPMADATVDRIRIRRLLSGSDRHSLRRSSNGAAGARGGPAGDPGRAHVGRGNPEVA